MKLTKIEPRIFPGILSEETSGKVTPLEISKSKPITTSRGWMSTLSALTLGTLALIKSAGADDAPKPGAPPPQKQVQLKPADIPNLVKNKLDIPEELFDKLIDDHAGLLSLLPIEVGVKIAKRGFLAQIKALKENSSNLITEESRVYAFLLYMSDEKLKSILKESKNEFQELIEVYINALADEGNKRKNTKEESASWNGWTLDTKLLTSRVIEAAPEGMFKGSWYSKIEKITERIDKEFTVNFPHETKRWAMNSIVALAKLESNGNKEPKLYKTLLTFLDKEQLDISSIAVGLPELIQVELVKKMLNGTKKALINNSSDLDFRENSTERLLISFSGDALKTLLLKTKNEYQELVEAYIDALADKENKRKNTADERAYFNSWALSTKILSPSLYSIPPELIKETWYPKIERAADRIDREFKSDGYSSIAAEAFASAVVKLSNLERREDSGIKEPKLHNVLVALVDKGYVNAGAIISGLPEVFQINLTKSVFNNARKALINNSPDLQSRENRAGELLDNFTNGTLNSVLLKTRNEYQGLVEAYIDALADKENKRANTSEESASWNAYILDIKLLGSSLSSAPPGLFKETWYTKIEKIIDRINNELIDISPHNARGWAQNAVTGLMLLELKNDSGIKEPRIFQKLIEYVNKNPKTYFPLNYGMLHNAIAREAFVNDRVSKITNLIVPKDSLMQPYEKLIQGIVNNLPLANKTEEEFLLYDSIIQAAILFAKPPINCPKYITDLQERKLSLLSKAKIEEIPDALAQFQEKIFHQASPEMISAGEKHLIPIISIGLKGLLDEDSKKNDAGLRIILTAQNFYRGYSIPLTKDESLNKLCNQIFDRFQNKELKDDTAIRTHIDFISNIQNKETQDTKLLEMFTVALNNQMTFTSKAKEKVVNPGELLQMNSREVELLRGTNELMDYFKNNPDHLKHVETLFKATKENILKDAFSGEVLNQGRELFTKVTYFPTDSKERGKETRRFFKETLMPYFDLLLERSKNLSKSEKVSFQKAVYTGLTLFFIDPNNPNETERNSFILDDTLKSVSKNCFHMKNENKLEEFTDFLIKDNAGYLWRRHMFVKMLDLEKDYLNSALKETADLLDSKEANVQLATLENLVSYRNLLKYVEPGLASSSIVKTICTKEEQESVKNLIGVHINTVDSMLTDKFTRVNVIREIIPGSLDHVIRDDVFIASAKSIENLISSKSTQVSLLTAVQTRMDSAISSNKISNKKYLEIIDTRLMAESDPRTRGMLYRTMAKLNPDKTLLLERFKKAIATEDSPITVQYIGQELGEIFFKEMKELPEYKLLYTTSAGVTLTWTEKVSKFSERIGLFNKNLEMAIKTGKNIGDENMPIQNMLSFLVNNSRGQNLTGLVKENLSEELLEKLNSRKEGDETDPRIIKVAFKIISNSSNALSGFLQKVSYDEVREKYITWIDNDNYDKEKKVQAEFNNLNKNISSFLEYNLRWGSSLDTLPHIAGALLCSSGNSSEDLKVKANFLAEKIFKGTKDRLGMFELYESGLQNRFIRQYLENYRKLNGRDASTEENCRTLLGRIEDVEKLQSPEERIKGRRNVELEISRLDLELYSKTVRGPLEQARLKFMEEFIMFAGNRQRGDYIGITLNIFGLRNYIPANDLNRIVGITN